VIGDIFQPTHLLFILAVALLVLGPKRLPEVGRMLGRGIRDFRGAMAGIETEFHDATNLGSEPPAAPAPAALPQPLAAEPAEQPESLLEPVPVVGPAAPQPLPESAPEPFSTEPD
jgi:sec-independent protein translocase protein TatA